MTAFQCFLLGIPAGVILQALAAPLILCAFPALVSLRWPRYRPLLIAASFGLMSGWMRMALVPPLPPLPTGNIRLQATIDDVHESWTKTTYVLSNLTASGLTPTTQNAQATVRSSVSEGEPGDRIIVAGILESPPPFLAAHSIQATMHDAVVLDVSSAPPGLQAALHRLRRAAERQIEQLLPAPENALLAGLILGTDDRLPETSASDFRLAGLSHLTAVSGANIALILNLFAGALWWLPKRLQPLPLAVAIGAFTLLVGAPASAVRAAMSGIIGLIALRSKRPHSGRSALIVALALMTLIEPRQLIADAGFQLSFLATIGIIELHPVLNTLFGRFLPPSLAEATSVTLAAELPTLPWSAWVFGRLSLLAPLTNLAAMPLSALASSSGLILFAVGILAPPLAFIARPFAWLSLSLLLGLAHESALLGAKLPDPGAPPLLALLCWECGLFFAALRIDRAKVSAARAMSG